MPVRPLVALREAPVGDAEADDQEAQHPEADEKALLQTGPSGTERLRKARSPPEEPEFEAFGTRLPIQGQWQVVCERPTPRTVQPCPFNGRRPTCSRPRSPRRASRCWCGCSRR